MKISRGCLITWVLMSFLLISAISVAVPKDQPQQIDFKNDLDLPRRRERVQKWRQDIKKDVSDFVPQINTFSTLTQTGRKNLLHQAKIKITLSLEIMQKLPQHVFTNTEQVDEKQMINVSEEEQTEVYLFRKIQQNILRLVIFIHSLNQKQEKSNQDIIKIIAQKAEQFKILYTSRHPNKREMQHFNFYREKENVPGQSGSSKYTRGAGVKSNEHGAQKVHQTSGHPEIFTVQQLGIGKIKPNFHLRIENELKDEVEAFTRNCLQHLSLKPIIQQPESVKAQFSLLTAWKMLAQCATPPVGRFPSTEHRADYAAMRDLNSFVQEIKKKIAESSETGEKCIKLFVMYTQLKSRRPNNHQDIFFSIIEHILQEIYKKLKIHYCDVQVLDLLSEINIYSPLTQKQTAFLYLMIGSYHVVVARIVSKESVGIKYCLTTKAYLEYLQAILTLIPPPKEDITCLSEAVKTLINKVIQLQKAELVNKQQQSLAQYAAFIQKQQLKKRKAKKEKDIQPIYKPNSVYPDFVLPQASSLIIDKAMAQKLLQWVKNELSYLRDHPFVDRACQTAYVKKIRLVLKTLQGITNTKEFVLQNQVQSALKYSEYFLVGGREVFLRLPWPYVQMQSEWILHYKRAYQRYIYLFQRTQGLLTYETKRLVPLVQILLASMRSSVIFQRKLDGTYFNEQAGVLYHQTQQLYKQIKRKLPFKTSQTQNWPQLEHQKKNPFVRSFQYIDYVIDSKLNPANFPQVETISFSSKNSHLVYKYYKSMFDIFDSTPMQCPQIEKKFYKSALLNLKRISNFLESKNLMNSKERADHLFDKIWQRNSQPIRKIEQMSQKARQRVHKYQQKINTYFPIPQGDWSYHHLQWIIFQLQKATEQLQNLRKQDILSTDLDFAKTIICKLQIVILLLNGCSEQFPQCMQLLPNLKQQLTLAFQHIMYCELRPFPNPYHTSRWVQCKQFDMAQMQDYFNKMKTDIDKQCLTNKDQLALVGYIQSVCTHIQKMIQLCNTQQIVQDQHNMILFKSKLTQLKKQIQEIYVDRLKNIDFGSYPQVFRYPTPFAQCTQAQNNWIQSSKEFLKRFSSEIQLSLLQDKTSLKKRQQYYKEVLNFVTKSCPQFVYFILHWQKDLQPFRLNRVYPWTHLTYSRILRANQYYKNELQIMRKHKDTTHNNHILWRCAYLEFLYEAFNRLYMQEISFFLPEEERIKLLKYPKKPHQSQYYWQNRINNQIPKQLPDPDLKKQDIIITQLPLIKTIGQGFNSLVNECMNNPNYNPKLASSITFSHPQHVWSIKQFSWFLQAYAFIQQKRIQILKSNYLTNIKVEQLKNLLGEALQIYALARGAPITPGQEVNGDTITMLMDSQVRRLYFAIGMVQTEQDISMFIQKKSWMDQYSRYQMSDAETSGQSSSNNQVSTSSNQQL